jgi:hypothetical protein
VSQYANVRDTKREIHMTQQIVDPDLLDKVWEKIDNLELYIIQVMKEIDDLFPDPPEYERLLQRSFPWEHSHPTGLLVFGMLNTTHRHFIEECCKLYVELYPYETCEIGEALKRARNMMEEWEQFGKLRVLMNTKLPSIKRKREANKS